MIAGLKDVTERLEAGTASFVTVTAPLPSGMVLEARRAIGASPTAFAALIGADVRQLELWENGEQVTGMAARCIGNDGSKPLASCDTSSSHDSRRTSGRHSL